jgi:hypothetical protein
LAPATRRCADLPGAPFRLGYSETDATVQRTALILRRAFLAGFALHTVALLWVWLRFGVGARGAVVVWMDLPWSLLYLGAARRLLFAVSCLVGGLWWGLLGLGFARLVGRSAHRETPA